MPSWGTLRLTADDVPSSLVPALSQVLDATVLATTALELEACQGNLITPSRHGPHGPHAILHCPAVKKIRIVTLPVANCSIHGLVCCLSMSLSCALGAAGVVSRTSLML